MILLIVFAVAVYIFPQLSSPGSEEKAMLLVLGSDMNMVTTSLSPLLEERDESTITIKLFPEGEYSTTAEVTRELQDLIASYGEQDVLVYGPTYFPLFSATSTSFIYQAFTQVAAGYPHGNVHFFMYETKPETESFARTQVRSIQRYFEDQLGFRLIKRTFKDVIFYEFTS